MKKFLIICCLVGSYAIGQNNSEMRIKNDYSAFNANLSGAWIFNNQVNDVQGSFYLFKDWNTHGIIITNKNQNLSLSGLNFNTNSNSFVAKISEDSVYVFNNGNIKEVVINKRKFRSYYYNGVEIYLEILGAGNNLEILKRNEKNLKKGILNPLTQQSTADRYLDKVSYFYNSKGKILEFKLTKKSFMSIFGNKSEDVQKYISKNNFSIKDENNFQTILSYYNTL